MNDSGRSRRPLWISKMWEERLFWRVSWVGVPDQGVLEDMAWAKGEKPTFVDPHLTKPHLKSQLWGLRDRFCYTSKVGPLYYTNSPVFIGVYVPYKIFYSDPFAPVPLETKSSWSSFLPCNVLVISFTSKALVISSSSEQSSFCSCLVFHTSSLFVESLFLLSDCRNMNQSKSCQPVCFPGCLTL